MGNLRLWWQIQTDRMGLTDAERPAPTMNPRAAVGFATLFGIVGTSQLAVAVANASTGQAWGLIGLLGAINVLVSAIYLRERRRAKRLAHES